MIKITALILFLLLTFFSVITFSQIVQTETNPIKEKNNNSKKLISKGVINGKALQLIEPEYPKAAKSINLSGKVLVEVILDEAGYVSEAKALTGHPILRKSSVDAAESSRFAPFFQGKTPIRVRGIIVYHFIPQKPYWLELGFIFPEIERIKNSLPEGFAEEKLLIAKLNSTETPYDPKGYETLILAIENKLRNNEKELWLFQLGRIIKKLINKNIAIRD